MSTTYSHIQQTRRSRRTGPLTAVLVTAVLVAGCATGSASGSTGSATTAATGDGIGSNGVFLDSSTIHDISVDFDQADYEAMIETYAATEEKDWIAADVTIDGILYEQVGIRLKGNSSLRGLGGVNGPGGGRAGGAGSDVSSDNPEELPWLIRLDKFVDGQNHEGIYDLVVRSNNSETALNEAVALELLEAAGLASQEAAYAAFSVNGSEQVLRLVIEHPDDVWLEDAFADAGVLYKAEATGDYSYRGDDPDAYDEVFDLEAGEENGDLTPLMEFLDFINNADDDTFNSELADRLDVNAFATYLAMQELIDNFDDIDGPGNNSYLYYNAETGSFTVVAWDHNLVFGALGNGGEPGGFARPDAIDPSQGFEPPEGFDPGVAPPEGFERGPGAPRDGNFTPPEGFEPGDGGARGMADERGGSNVLVERFLTNDDWQALYGEKLEELRTALYDSGVASEILDTWTDLLINEAAELIQESDVTDEAESIAAYFS